MANNPQGQTLDARRKRFFIKNIKDEGSLQKSGNRFILTFLKIYEEHITDELKTVIHGYMSEVLHSIFFLGNIQKEKIMPTNFFEEKELLKLKNKFSKPFNEFCTHLPTRTPFSILLDAVVKIKGSQNETQVMEYLSTLLKELSVPKPTNMTYSNYYTLEATVICICHYERTGGGIMNKFYGASLSCKGPRERQVIISLSCRHTWNLKVAYAVDLAGQGGAIQFPQTVKCKAFKRNRGKGHYCEKPPCTNCINIFKGVTFEPRHSEADEEAKWLYGNCAETESLSKLLNADPALCEQVQVLKNNMTTDLDLESTVWSNATSRLVELLSGTDYVCNGNDIQFFVPPLPSESLLAPLYQ
ncbi:uncharacterized protein LOC117965191 isoform X2 [Acipenser ruthenus]|uniref:uncharacterized protein LOC117965191 isoform X2 n=1 Tax=Acipenser ruthenus TaxID=7906 RepID=UPI00274271AA|nr:uncharacterized protein LOC117965191 isoform X2 [Acipenser ruthenus]